jgi:hypothetical protein
LGGPAAAVRIRQSINGEALQAACTWNREFREDLRWNPFFGAEKPGGQMNGDFCAEKGITVDLIRHEQARRNSEFGTSGGFEFPDERASVVYWNEWHKRLLRLRVR